MSNPFDYLNSINVSKTNMMRGTENDNLAEKDYNAFLINRGLSYHNDTIGLANEMNMRHEIDSVMQYEFLLNTVRSKKRYAKWHKKENDSDLELIKEFYNYSDTKALQALNVLSDEQLKQIKIKMAKGGRDA
jgi:exonuclease I